MTTYISILRGINVSGKNIIKMEALKKMYIDLGFKDIQTYIQSGNVIFSSDITDIQELQNIISSNIEIEFLLKIPVIVFDHITLKNIIQNQPFTELTEQETTNLYVTFLQDAVENIDLHLLENKLLPDDKIFCTEQAIYFYCPQGYGKTKLTNNYIESKLKATATTRNWKTCNQLYLLSSKA